ncbi:MAG: hypothetical protein H2069_05895 [Legionella sp.]|nr:hypothetical protein [Legionella sp.]
MPRDSRQNCTHTILSSALFYSNKNKKPQTSAHQVDTDAYTLDKSDENASPNYHPSIKKTNKYPGQRGADASVLEVLFNAVANLFTKTGIVPPAQLILDNNDKVVGVASANIALQIEESLNAALALKNLENNREGLIRIQLFKKMPSDSSEFQFSEGEQDINDKKIPISNAEAIETDSFKLARKKAMPAVLRWRYNCLTSHAEFDDIPTQETHDLLACGIDMAQMIKEDMATIVNNDGELAFTESVIAEVVRDIRENTSTEPDTELGKIFKRRFHLNQLKQGIHFLDQYPDGFFNEILQKAREGDITIDIPSLVAVLTLPYISEDDDPHKGNIGFYVLEEDGQKKIVFVKFDCDLCFLHDIMAPRDLRFPNLFLMGNANKITTRDLEHFPVLENAQLHYWPTNTRYFAKSSKAYSKRDACAFRSLVEGHDEDALAPIQEAFEKEKWKCFLKHIVMPINMVEEHLNRVIPPEIHFDKIILVKDAVSDRLRQLRKAMFKSEQFLAFYSQLKSFSTKGKKDAVTALKQDIIKEIEGCLQPDIPKEIREQWIKQILENLDTVFLFLESKLPQHKLPQQSLKGLLNIKKGLSSSSDGFSSKLASTKKNHALNLSPYDSASRKKIIAARRISSDNDNISLNNFRIDQKNLNDPSLIRSILEKKFASSTDQPKQLLEKVCHLSSLSKAICLDYYPFYSTGKNHRSPTKDDIEIAYQAFKIYEENLQELSLTLKNSSEDNPALQAKMEATEKNAFKYACIVNDLIRRPDNLCPELLEEITHFRRKYVGFDDAPVLVSKNHQHKKYFEKQKLSFEAFERAGKRIQESDLPLKQKKAELCAVFEAADFSLFDLVRLKFELGKVEPDSLSLKFLNQCDHHLWFLKKLFGPYGFTNTNKKLRKLIDEKIARHSKKIDEFSNQVNQLNKNGYFYSAQFFRDLQHSPEEVKAWLIDTHDKCKERIEERKTLIGHLETIKESHIAIGMDSSNFVSRPSLLKKQNNFRVVQSQAALSPLRKTIATYEKQIEGYEQLAQQIDPTHVTGTASAKIYQTIDAFIDNKQAKIKPISPADNILFVTCTKYDGKKTSSQPSEQSNCQAQQYFVGELSKPTEFRDREDADKDTSEPMLAIPAYELNTEITNKDPLKYDIYFQDDVHSLVSSKQVSNDLDTFDPPTASFIESPSTKTSPYKLTMDHFPQASDFKYYQGKAKKTEALESARIVYCYMMLVQFFQQGKKPLIWSRDPEQFNYTIAVLKKIGPIYGISKDELAACIAKNSPCQLPRQPHFLCGLFQKNPLADCEKKVEKYASIIKGLASENNTSINTYLETNNRLNQSIVCV